MRSLGIGGAPAIIESILDLSPDFIQSFLQSWSEPPDAASHALGLRNSLEGWPKALHDLSMQSAGFALTDDERDAVVQLWGEYHFPDGYSSVASAWANSVGVFGELRNAAGARLCDSSVIADLTRKTTAAIESLPFERPFFKLGGRSPKNSPFWPCSNGRVENGEQVMMLIFTGNRACEDFFHAQLFSAVADARDSAIAGKPLPAIAQSMGVTRERALGLAPEAVSSTPWFWFREYAEMAQHAELRCFMIDREFVGATQYHGIVSTRDGGIVEKRAFPELVQHRAEYESLILDWFPTFRDACPPEWSETVFDVVVDRKAGQVLLIETNPALPGTYPGLMDWREPSSFDGRLHVVDADWRSRKIVLKKVDLARLEALAAAHQKGLSA